MKLIIAGSRNFHDYNSVEQKINDLVKLNFPSCVISGCCQGADRIGELWAEKNNTPVVKFPADWDKFGKQAGPIRNKQMAEYADALILIWDGKSKGSKNMLEEAKKSGLAIRQIKIEV